MSGGVSREAWSFDVSWADADGHHDERCVMLAHPRGPVRLTGASVSIAGHDGGQDY